MTPPARVVLLTRDGCHLCVEAEATAARTCAEMGVSWRALDVDSDPELRARYTDHVPVTFVDQKLLGYWFLDGAALREALTTSQPRPMLDEWISSLTTTKP